MSNNGTPYREEALYVTEDTTVDQVVAYLRHCIENPVQQGDNIIWNFSTHEIDWSALDIEDKNQNRFIIPYQVTGTWGFIYQLLPEDIKSAELLVYHANDETYYAYRNFYRTTGRDRQDQIRQDLGRRLEASSVSEELGLHE